MPVTARLSQKFYERFGDEIANEFVDWFNAVDATYQAQLKDVNELNWARMQSRFSAFDARIDALEAKLTARMDAFEARMKSQLGALEARMESQLGALEGRMESQMGALEVRLESRMEVKLSRQRAQLITWMFAFWTATLVPIIGVMLALSGAFRG